MGESVSPIRGESSKARIQLTFSNCKLTKTGRDL